MNSECLEHSCHQGPLPSHFPGELTPRAFKQKKPAKTAPVTTPILRLRCADFKLFRSFKQHVQWLLVRSKIHDLKALTAELFVGKIEVEIESDPEIADCNYVVFHVTTNSDRGELPALRREWYHRTVKLLKNDCDKVRLVISVEE